MPSIDERIVSMAFENQVFEQRVATTMGTLSKLDSAVKNVGANATGFSNIENSANKVTLNGPMSALDRLKAKLGRSGEGAAQSMGDIERAGSKVTLEGPNKAIDKTKANLGQLGAGSTFANIENASNRVSLQGLTNALDNAKQKFSILEGAASVALGNVASKAIAKGTAFAKSFAVGPIIDGLHEYETNLKSIQTIQANTDQPLTKINKSLDELNRYSDQTIYNFSEMARNIGTFTAAGVDLKTATSSIKGIANMAALSGSNSQQAATAMYQLSQAISSGRVGLQDWNSVVNAGMGGKKLQNALAQTGVAMGKLDDHAVKMEGPMKKLTISGQSFRESIMTQGGAPSWLSSEILVNTLATLDGRFSHAALSAEKTSDGLQKYSKAEIEAKIATARHALEQKNGVKYTDAQFKSLMKLSDSAFKSATEVKTLGQVFDVAKETIGSGWSASFRSIFGGLNEAKKTFTELSNTINGFINANSLARNQVLHDWKQLGGRTALIDGIKAGFQALIGIIKPIGQAFRDIFPRQTGKDLFEMTKSFKDLMISLKPSETLINNLRRIFGGFFAVVHIGWTVVKELVGVIGDLLGVAGKGSGGFLSFVAGIGDFLKATDVALTKGGLLKTIFEGIGAVLKVPISLLGSLAGAILGLFGENVVDKGKGFEDSLQGVNDKLGPLKGFIDLVVSAWKKFADVVGDVKTALDPWFSQLAEKLSGLGGVLTDAFKGLNPETLMQGLQTGFIAGIFLTLKKALGGGGGLASVLSPLKDTLKGVNDLIGGFTGQMSAMQSALHAQALLGIALAIGALAAGVFILSTIDADKLAKAMTAVAVGLGELVAATKVLSVGGGKFGGVNFAIIAAGMIALAIAVTILAAAMKIFATMSWEDIAKGLAGVAGALVGVGLAMKVMPSGPGLVVQAAGITVIAVALNILAAAVKSFASLSWEDLARGLTGVMVSLLGIGTAMAFIPPTIPATAAGMLLLSIALSAIGGAVKLFGEMDMFKMVQGLAGMAAAIVAIGLAMDFVPPHIGLIALGLLVLGQAMVVTAGAIALLGSLSIGTLVKGIISLGATLLVLASGLTLMIVALPGAAALMVAATALMALVPALGILGTMKWSTIFKGLASIALVMVAISVAGLVAAPGLIALGIALIPLGVGLLIVASAAKLFASAISMMSDSGQKGFAILLAAITGFVLLLPNLIITLVKDIIGIADQLVTLAPKIVTALGKILGIVTEFIVTNAPRLAVAVGALISAVIKVFGDNTAPLVAAGAKVLLDLLTGIGNNIGQITTKVSDIMIRFLNALAAKAPNLVAAGVNLMTSFLRGVGNKMGAIVSSVSNLIVKFVTAVGTNAGKVATAGTNMILKFIGAIAAFVPRMIAKGTDILINFLTGIQNAIPRVKDKALAVARAFLNNLGDGLVKMADTGARAITRFLHGLADAIRRNDDQMIDAGWDVASAIGNGMLKGLASFPQKINDYIHKILSGLPPIAKKVLHISSPSKVFEEIGVNTMRGFSQGIEKEGPNTHKKIYNTFSNIKPLSNDALSKALKDFHLEDEMDTEPRITPVLDLSKVKKEAGKIKEIINPSVASAHAIKISEQQLSSDLGFSATMGPLRPIHFEQNNYSPDPISNVDLYRQTNNQLSRAKSAVGVT